MHGNNLANNNLSNNNLSNNNSNNNLTNVSFSQQNHLQLINNPLQFGGAISSTDSYKSVPFPPSLREQQQQQQQQQQSHFHHPYGVPNLTGQHRLRAPGNRLPVLDNSLLHQQQYHQLHKQHSTPRGYSLSHQANFMRPSPTIVGSNGSVAGLSGGGGSVFVVSRGGAVGLGRPPPPAYATHAATPGSHHNLLRSTPPLPSGPPHPNPSVPLPVPFHAPTNRYPHQQQQYDSTIRHPLSNHPNNTKLVSLSSQPQQGTFSPVLLTQQQQPQQHLQQQHLQQQHQPPHQQWIHPSQKAVNPSCNISQVGFTVKRNRMARISV